VATITKVGKKFRAQIRRKNAPSMSRTFATRRDAEAFASGLEHDVLADKYLGRSLGVSIPRLGEALKRYGEEVTSKKRGVASEMCNIRIWQRHELAGYKLDDITSDHIQAFADESLNSPGTVRKKLAVISHLYTKAITRWGYKNLVNPTVGVDKPKVPNSRSRRLQYGEYRRLMREIVVGRPSLRPVVRLAIYTAMRRGELCSLEFAQINYRERFAHLSVTKNGDKRDVPLSRRAIRVLREVEILSKTGKVWDHLPSIATYHFSEACKRAGIEGLTLHDLRHEATSRFFEVHNLSIVEVQRITGHKDLKMLLAYTHLSPSNIALKLG